ncbi:MAG: hypothetical protein ACJARY_003696 [Candidatus Azotimanducaceae bacterium]|jgi:hypothetical protein
MALVASLGWLASCATVTSSVTTGLATDLADAIMNSADVETIREGVPAYLIMLDSFLRNSPDDESLLLAASALNGAFSALTEESRTRLLTDKSLNYAFRASCANDAKLCGFRTMEFSQFKARIDDLKPAQIEVIYATGVAWTGWIQAHSDDWNAIAELARVKYLMSRVLILDELWAQGGPHLYMGGLETILPAAMGGKPEIGRQHFERAIEIASGEYLMTKVIYAEQYAKLTFNKSLYEQLLNEVLSADPVKDGLTLTNVLAQQRAKVLLAEADDYF